MNEAALRAYATVLEAPDDHPTNASSYLNKHATVDDSSTGVIDPTEALAEPGTPESFEDPSELADWYNDQTSPSYWIREILAWPDVLGYGSGSSRTSSFRSRTAIRG